MWARTSKINLHRKKDCAKPEANKGLNLRLLGWESHAFLKTRSGFPGYGPTVLHQKDIFYEEKYFDV